MMTECEGGEIDLEKSLGVGYKQKTIFGGFLAIIAWLLFLGEFGLTLNKLYWQRDSVYSLNDIFIPNEELGETIVNLDELDKNYLKFIFGMNAGEIDVLNNPYFTISGYQASFSGVYYNYTDSFVKEHLQVLYNQPLCFKEKDKVYVRGNWWSEEEEVVVGYRIRYCANSTENGDWCKSKEEVDEWLLYHNSYFVYQDSKVNAKIWGDDPTVKDEESYFPITSVDEDDFMYHKMDK
jgi:hypothetical protein